MGFRNLQTTVSELEATGQLRRVTVPLDADLEVAEVHRRVNRAGGPALLFTNVKGCRFPLLSNLFGTLERTRWLFRDAIDSVKKLVDLKVDPSLAARRPWRFWDLPLVGLRTLPRWRSRGPILANQTTVSNLPSVRCWPRDGGPFITLPLVYTEDPDRPGFAKSNLGMYRIQLSGGAYQPDTQIGMHYQIHRGIGVHHAKALAQGKPLRVHIFVGGPPALTVSAVMPLPEGMPELTFAGALAGHRIPYVRGPAGLPIPAEADFCIVGTIEPNLLLPEGPFGDHLGYYSLAHDFPVLRVERVYHRNDAIWPFTVVGRPPQEDTSFGAFIHELTGPAIPSVLPGVKEVHAVDAAGVHPLLLAIGSERYVPYADRRRPQELLTQANAILGQGQLSLAKFLLIVAREDVPTLDLHDIPAFFRHLLERIDWSVDVHFQTQTTIDTLDYSGTGLNQGSKVVWAAAGPVRRPLPSELPTDLPLPSGFHTPTIPLHGILAITGPRFPVDGGVENSRFHQGAAADVEDFCQAFTPADPINRFPLVVLADDSRFLAADFNNFLWAVFTRCNPASDTYGIGAQIQQKHWGCTGSLVLDARIKPHHAPPVVEDPQVAERVDKLFQPGGPLHGLK